MTTDTTREREAFVAATQGVYSLRRRWDGTYASMLTENLWQGWLLRDAALAQRHPAPGQSELQEALWLFREAAGLQAARQAAVDRFCFGPDFREKVLRGEADNDLSIRSIILGARAAIAALAQRQPAQGQSELAREEAAHLRTIDERDLYHEWADKLAHAIGGEEIGEHSNINNPWQNALDIADEREAALAHHGRSAGVEASEVERRARAAFELWREEITSSVAPSWDKQPEETRHRYRAEARATLATAPQPPAASSDETVKRFRHALALCREATDESRDPAASSSHDAGERQPAPHVEIDYTNWRGERARRLILPGTLSFKATEWHPEPQWLLVAVDLEKDEVREFAVRDIHSWGRATPDTVERDRAIVERYREAMHVGVEMGNIVWNAGRGRTFSEHEQKLCREVAERWDAAIRAAAPSQTASGPATSGDA